MDYKKERGKRKRTIIKSVKKKSNDEGSTERLQYGGKDRKQERKMEKVK